MGAYSIPLIFLVLVALGGYLGFDSKVEFHIKDFHTKELIYSRTMKVGETFTLKYIHSVTKQPVYEVYSIKNKSTISVIEMRFDTFGPNLPVGPEVLEKETTSFFIEDGYYRVTFQNREFKQIPLRIGQVIANHTLIFADDTQLSLVAAAGGGRLVELSVNPRRENRF